MLAVALQKAPGIDSPRQRGQLTSLQGDQEAGPDSQPGSHVGHILATCQPRLAKLRTEFDGDFEVAGPNLAAQFIQRGLVDRYEMLIHPVILGAGTPYLPPLDERQRLRLADSRTFASGVTYLAYERV